MNTGLERLLVGRALAGRYVLQEILGRGGMSIVFRSLDETLGRTVAVKLIHLPHGEHEMRENLRRRFRREAAAAARIPPHLHVVRVYDYGTDPDLDLDFIVMELLEGTDLAAALREAQPPLAEAVRILLEAARGIAAGHRVGVVHRDIKPGNIFLIEADGQAVRVLDFGIAKVLEAESDEDLTIFGQQPHSPAYASPEQLDPRRPLTPAADVYQLGLVGYELIAGCKPYSAAEREEIRSGRMIPLPERGGWASVPPPLRNVVECAVLPQPADRYRDARVLVEALEAAVLETPVLRRQVLVPDEASRAESGLRSGTEARHAPVEPEPEGSDLTLQAEDHAGSGSDEETLFAHPGEFRNPRWNEPHARSVPAGSGQRGEENLHEPIHSTPPVQDPEAGGIRGSGRRRRRGRGTRRRIAMLTLLTGVVIVIGMWGAARMAQSRSPGEDPLRLELEDAFRELESEAARRLEREGIWERQ